MKYDIRITGTRPLLTHNVRLASPLDPFARKMKQLNGKQSKNRTDEDRIEMARVEWEGGMYFDPQIGPYIPAENVFQSFVEGARLTRQGKNIERGIQFLGDIALPLLYDGPRTLDAMWGGGLDSAFLDIRPVTVGRVKVDRARAVFRTWGLEAEVLIDESIIDPETFEQIVITAGLSAGLGDYRRHYGRYDGKAIPAA